MPNFNRSGGGNSGKKYGKKDFVKRSFGGRDSGRPAMLHDAICGECGNQCKVPFKPSGDKPVFCKDCFKNNSTPSSKKYGEREFKDRNFGRDSGNKHAEQSKEQFAILNAKLDRILKALTSDA